MSVLMVVAPEDFRDEELFEPRQLLEEAGIAVTVASTCAGTCTGLYGTRVEARLPLAEVDTTDYDAVVFVGGPGAEQLFWDAHAHRIAVEMARARKVVAAISTAPAILARAGVLRGRRATVIDTEVASLVQGRALVRSLGLVSDGPFITAAGPHRARGLGARVVKALTERAQHLPVAALSAVAAARP